MKVKTWKLTDDSWALYTEELEKAKAALQRPALCLMGTYYRRSGELFAWQFVGPKEEVLALAQKYGR